MAVWQITGAIASIRSARVKRWSSVSEFGANLQATREVREM